MSLLLVMGIPASGKSTLCQMIAAASSHSAQIEVVEFDRVVGRRVEDFNAAEARNAFEQAIKLKMEKFGENWQGLLIVDDIFYLQSMRRPFERAARRLGWRFAVAAVRCELSVAVQRNRQRPAESRVDETTIQRIFKEISFPDDAIFLNDSGVDVDDVLRQVRNRPKLAAIRHAEAEGSRAMKRREDEWEKMVRSCVGQLVAEGFDGKRIAAAKRLLKRDKNSRQHVGWILEAGSYYGTSNGRLWKLWRIDGESVGGVGYKVVRRQASAEQREDRQVLEGYFQCRICLKELYKRWMEDGHMKALLDANQSLKGIRILQQQPVETILSFICSANNHIQRISKMVNRLCVLYGKELETVEDSTEDTAIAEKHPYLKFDFPSLEQLSKNTDKMEETLRKEGFGYRAAYIRNTAIHLSKLGEEELLKWRSEKADSARQKLLELSGVGPKVADCIALMAMQKHEVVPVDTHVFEVTRKIYLPKLSGKSLNANLHKEIRNFYIEKFGPHAGWAQAVLFNAQLEEKSSKGKKRTAQPEKTERSLNLILGQEDPEGRDTKYTYRQICVVDGKPTILNGFDCKSQVAVARWQNSVNTTGWTFLEVETRDGFEPGIQAYAAGYLEGLLSHTVLTYHVQNAISYYCANFTGYCGRMKAFLTDNQNWIKDKLATVARDDVYWGAVNRTFYQLSGLIDAYENRPYSPRITYEIHEILLMNWGGDFYDLEKKLNKTRDPAIDQTGGHCSGFVKVGNLKCNPSNPWAIWKPPRDIARNSMGLGLPNSPPFLADCPQQCRSVHLASDYEWLPEYAASSEALQLPTWVRAIVSNQLARDAREWCKIYSKYNSGTYNNQWFVNTTRPREDDRQKAIALCDLDPLVVVDYNKFTPNKEVPDYGIMYVLEQMPGKIVYADLTWFLKKYSYFPSYNIPYFEEIRNISGFVGQADKLGDWFKWGSSPRAKIFDRDHHDVVDIDSLTKLMRYNDYTHDEFSRCKCSPPYSAEAGISARGDLNLANGTYEFPGQGHVNHGALDYKGTNSTMMKTLQFRSQGGPTWGSVPPFRWSNFDFKDKVKHVGHPDLWKFDWLEHKWETDIHAK
ncbi:hypothetical protein WR25_11700 [Diploscapter pachys]|uniref:HhH-GPD domain-containing protein n=1 Tax=Diploscapter pachys TaxID=2018661 RepID=A0A2A2KP33_9BILA|nr:hypothetical protein WR25_11700 [Diploscapter pachys]